jgi:hypothetical protein
MSDLMSDSGGFDLDDWMEGFDPDADFGGLGFEAVTGPGSVSVSVLDADGEFINGIIITEDGFRTDRVTRGDAPCEIDQVPYGERLYGVYLTHSFDIEDVVIIKHAATGGGEIERRQIIVEDVNDIPPVLISDESPKWELTFVLRQSMSIYVNYFLVSPNDRFYYLRYGGGDADSDGIAHRINTFENAPVRVAVYIEMPALKKIRRIRLEGKGFGDIIDDSGVYGERQDADYGGDAWAIESDVGDYSMPDWTFTDRSYQLTAPESIIGPDGMTHIKFFVLSLPEASEGAALRFDDIILIGEGGEEIRFSNPGESDLTVRIVSAPQLL